ncbi:hypothetical protein [Rhodoferax sp.]|uniref:hypothetical protein n=1 Tax=Rhodoferax sp. TaxID=50421 RepID=UPI002731D1CA|nr:hypothetical protein [Rhodoferax sp.]MDP2443287.1 hypothetical protein [Rhodoferax sp.]MDZ4206811.1 hypothetical protein [Rhodoferax sp.]
MKIDTLLTPSEMVDLNALVAQAHQDGAGSVRMHLANRGLVVIGILGGGQLLTWFCAPAKTINEAILTETAVIAGIGAIGLAYSIELELLATESADLATKAIRKAAQCKMH